MRALNRPIRVCFLIDELAAAGTEMQLVALIRHLDRTRVCPYLALLRGDSEASRQLGPEDCPIFRLGVGALRSPRAAVQAIRFIHFLWRERIDVVQVYFPDSTYFGVPAAWLAGVPHRVRTRNNIGHWLTARHRLLGRALNLFTTATIANCDAARRALLSDEKPGPQTVFVLPNGVDLERFLALPLPSGPARQVGAVANLRLVKGLDVLVEAAGRLKDDFPDVCFSVAGEGEDRRLLEGQIALAGLRERFHLDGSRMDVPGFLAGLDVAVLPSRAEGMSNAVLEYMAAARPIVATRVGAMPEVIRDGEHGLLVPPDDPGALARAIARLLADRTLALRLAGAARVRAQQEFSRAAMVRRFEDFYTRLIHQPQRDTHAAARA
jgi:glycosyltransferase involved in cell wall biosynthesis